MSKTCTKCGESKPLEQFSPKGDRYRSRCKPCTTADNMERYTRNKKVLSDMKMERGCERCGYNEHYGALHWDHIDPTTKSFQVGESTSSRGLKALLAEAAKCRVLCANCHAIRTWHEEDY